MASNYDVQSFDTEVLERSNTLPVLVDFWADWCGPCRVLGPVLESLAGEEEAFAKPRWTLAKVDTEKFGEISARYGVRGIPNVKLFHHGEVIDEFTGALPEAQVRSWLESALPDPNAERLGEADRLLKDGNTEDALAIVEEVLNADPGNNVARLLKAESIAIEDPAAAADMVSDIRQDSDLYDRAEGLRVLAKIADLLERESELPESDARRPLVEGGRAALSGNFDAALERFVEAIRADRYYADDMARRACIAIFKYLGEDHEVVRRHRRAFDRSLY